MEERDVGTLGVTNIPNELKDYDQWVIWRRAKGKNYKRPLRAKDGQPAR